MNRILRVLLLVGMAGTLCLAGPISITNNSFETPALAPGGYVNDAASGWIVTGDAGDWYPSPIASFFSTAVPDGNQVLAVGYAHASDANQNLGVALTPNTTYTLTYWVGRRLDLSMSPYLVALDAGNTTTVLASDSAGAPTAGHFVQRTITFSTGSSPVSGNLIVDISATGLNSTQTDFDLVQLSSSPNGVPEPTTLSFLGIGIAAIAFATRRFRKA